MAGSSTARGAAADAKAEANGGQAEVEVSGSGVEVTPAVVSGGKPFENVTLYKGDETREATSRSELYHLKYDGFTTTKPKKS